MTELSAHDTSDFHFRTITWVNINGFSPNLVCALIWLRSGLGVLMGKVCIFLTELPANDTTIFLFPNENLSKCQWIFTKLSMCIDIMEIWFGITNGQTATILKSVICLWHIHIFCFWTITWVNLNRFWPNLIWALALWRSDLGLLFGTLLPIFDKVISLWHNNGRMLLFHVFIYKDYSGNFYR